MEVFIITKDVRFDTDSEFEVKAFATLEEARAELKKMCKVYREDASRDEWEIQRNDDDAFFAYLMGDECTDHYYFEIHNRKI